MGTTGSLLVLPIWDDVLDELALSRARPTIAALSLTCRSLRLPSQRALFRSLTFTGRPYSRKPGTSREVIENLHSDSSSRLRGYVRRVELCRWLPIERRVYASEDDQEAEESKQLKLTLLAVFSLLEHLPHLLSLQFSHVLLETDTLERLAAKLINLTNVEVLHCEWSSDNPPEDVMSVTPHAVKNVRIVPSFFLGGRIQPAMLHTARALIQPRQIQRLSLSACHGMDQLMIQLASSESHFPRLVSLALMNPPASSSSDIISFLRRSPALEELIIDRRNYSNWLFWLDQKDERDSISSNSRALETVTFVSGGFLPALKAFTGSLDETIAILKLPGVHIERLEVHRTFEHVIHEQAQAGRVAHEPLPVEVIDELMDALEMTGLESRNHVLELQCIDRQWVEGGWLGFSYVEQDKARKVSKPPQRARVVLPNLQTFAYSGPIFRKAERIPTQFPLPNTAVATAHPYSRTLKPSRTAGQLFARLRGYLLNFRSRTQPRQPLQSNRM